MTSTFTFDNVHVTLQQTTILKTYADNFQKEKLLHFSVLLVLEKRPF